LACSVSVLPYTLGIGLPLVVNVPVQDRRAFIDQAFAAEYVRLTDRRFWIKPRYAARAESSIQISLMTLITVNAFGPFSRMVVWIPPPAKTSGARKRARDEI
jgi:hypothetical protein